MRKTSGWIPFKGIQEGVKCQPEQLGRDALGWAKWRLGVGDCGGADGIGGFRRGAEREFPAGGVAGRIGACDALRSCNEIVRIWKASHPSHGRIRAVADD